MLLLDTVAWHAVASCYLFVFFLFSVLTFLLPLPLLLLLLLLLLLVRPLVLSLLLLLDCHAWTCEDTKPRGAGGGGVATRMDAMRPPCMKTSCIGYRPDDSLLRSPSASSCVASRHPLSENKIACVKSTWAESFIMTASSHAPRRRGKRGRITRIRRGRPMTLPCSGGLF